MGYPPVMLHGPLGDPDPAVRFSGHETFPLRRLWLRKAYDAVRASGPDDSRVFDKDSGLIRFGVGKNMVWAIRHWAQTCQVIAETEVQGHYRTAEIGELLFHPKEGVDPFMEGPATPWLLHWLIAGDHARATTWYYAFSHLNAPTFDREALAEPLRDLCTRLGRRRTSPATIGRDVDCFLRSYVPRTGGEGVEDQIEGVLGDLGLIREVGPRVYTFRRGAKPTLPDGVFAFSLLEFWARRDARHAGGSATLAVDAIAHEPGSPGRVFKMDEDAVTERLERIGDVTEGALTWSDTAGIRSVARRGAVTGAVKVNLLRSAYEASARLDARSAA